MAQICPDCGKKISPLSRNNGSEKVCPFCWKVVPADPEMEVENMRKDFGFVDDSNGLVEEYGACAGICTTCKHRLTCTYPGSPDNPKLFCEEFECEGAPCSGAAGDMGVVTPAPIEPLTGTDSGGQGGAKYLGLCVNCENREYCKFPKPAGGVWFCEEYK